MKRLLLIALMAGATQAALAADVGVSISIGDPGFYGRIDIGDAPRPAVIYERPVIIDRVYDSRPLYLRVPPGHAKNWGRYCGRYEACGRPVYFVQDRWYNDVYVPRYRERHFDDRPGPDHHWDDDRGHGHDHDDWGPGRGHGHGRGHDR